MNGIIRKLTGGERSVLVRVSTGSVEGKAYCKESKVGDYVSDMMRLASGSMYVMIEADRRN